MASALLEVFQITLLMASYVTAALMAYLPVISFSTFPDLRSKHVKEAVMVPTHVGRHHIEISVRNINITYHSLQERREEKR